MAVAVDVLGDVLEGVAAHERGHTGGVLHVFDHAPHFPPGFVDGLAVLGGEHFGDRLEVLLEGLFEAKEIPGPTQWRRFPPGWECFPGGRYRMIYVNCRTIGHAGDFLTFCRVINIAKLR
jgi:hypothetical protein